MQALNLFLKLFFFPGDYVIRKVGISIEEDGGILRSFINMCFWSVVILLCLPLFL